MHDHRQGLALAWRYQADQCEDEAECHRRMAATDDEHMRPDMADRNRRTAARLTGVADGLRQAARQLTTEVLT
jgi:hypothetical protein